MPFCAPTYCQARAQVNVLVVLADYGDVECFKACCIVPFIVLQQDSVTVVLQHVAQDKIWFAC